jgi:hypothetical protein
VRDCVRVFCGSDWVGVWIACTHTNKHSTPRKQAKRPKQGKVAGGRWNTSMSAPPRAARVLMDECLTIARLPCDTAVAKRWGLRRGSKAACTLGRCRSACMPPAAHASVCQRRRRELIHTKEKIAAPAGQAFCDRAGPCQVSRDRESPSARPAHGQDVRGRSCSARTRRRRVACRRGTQTRARAHDAVTRPSRAHWACTPSSVQPSPRRAHPACCTARPWAGGYPGQGRAERRKRQDALVHPGHKICDDEAGSCTNKSQEKHPTTGVSDTSHTKTCLDGSRGIRLLSPERAQSCPDDASTRASAFGQLSLVSTRRRTGALLIVHSLAADGCGDGAPRARRRRPANTAVPSGGWVV